jgi:hypothetical protein
MTRARTEMKGTWLEPEEMAYPNGSFTRRAHVRFADGKLRTVLCSIPDTYFTIPARARLSGKTIRGFISELAFRITPWDRSRTWLQLGLYKCSKEFNSHMEMRDFEHRLSIFKLDY